MSNDFIQVTNSSELFVMATKMLAYIIGTVLRITIIKLFGGHSIRYGEKDLFDQSNEHSQVTRVLDALDLSSIKIVCEYVSAVMKKEANLRAESDVVQTMATNSRIESHYGGW